MRKIPASEQPTTQLNVREVTSDPLVALPKGKKSRPMSWFAAMLILTGFCIIVGFSSGLVIRAAYFELEPQTEIVYEVVERPEPVTVASTTGENAAKTSLSPIFTPQVQFWSPLIVEWAVAWEIDPNLIATVIQIESCGDPFVSSSAGAQGLFQVMPFHFDPGEDMLNIQNNARRGLAYLSGGLDMSEGHAGLALAGYNGGHGVINRGYANWHSETQRYYYWGAGIYADATAGLTTSARLQEWLAAGGQWLCDRASVSQQDLSLQTLVNDQGR